VVQTPRIRIMFMSIRGCSLRASTTTQAAHTRSPSASRPSVFGEPQPQVVVSLTDRRTAEIPPLISAAASQFTRPGIFTGDSGMYRQAQNAAGTITTSGSQKSHCQPRCSTTRPPSTMPIPAPIPRIAEISPMPPATSCGGNSSRMIPKDSGKMPPPTPWITRATISRARLCETAASSVPPAKATSVQTRTCSLPNMSPRRPTIAVATDADSR